MHFGMVRTAEVNGEGASGSGDPSDLEGDFCDGEVIRSSMGGDDNGPTSELKKLLIIDLFELKQN